MSQKAKPKRRKKYTPKYSRNPPFAAELLPEFSAEQIDDLCITELMPIQALMAGEANHVHVMNLGSTLTFGAVVAHQVLKEVALFDLCKLGMVGLLFTDELLKKEMAIPDLLLDPVEEAVNQIVEIQRRMDRASLAYVFEEAQTRSRKLLAVNLGQAGLILPASETISRYAGRHGIAFVAHQAVKGRLSDQIPFAWISDTGAKYAIEDDALAYFNQKQR